jgi:hypothetical protein
MDFKAGGTGVAIGKIATEDNLFDVGLNMKISNTANTQSAITFLAGDYDDLSVLHSDQGNFGFFNMTDKTWLLRIDTNNNTFIPGDKIILGTNTDTTTKDIQMMHQSRQINISLNANKQFGFYDATLSKWVLNIDANGNVGIPEGRLIAPKSIAHGSVSITPSAANTPTSKAVTWTEMSAVPSIVVTPYTGVPGTQVTGCAVNNPSKTGCSIVVTRTNTSAFTVYYIAIN